MSNMVTALVRKEYYLWSPVDDDLLVENVQVIENLQDGSNARQQFIGELFDGQLKSTNQVLLSLGVIGGKLQEWS